MAARPVDPPSFTVEAGSADAGMRVDKFLATRIDSVSRSALQRLIGEGCVRIDGQPTQASDAKRKIQGSERIAIWTPKPAPHHVTPENIPIEIVFEDEHIVVVNKPHGLTVHPGSGQPDGTLANALVHHVASIASVGAEGRPGIVHRLDRDTSGVMVVAKDEASHRVLSAAFAERTVSKVYVACVHGQLDANEGTIELPLGRSLRNRTRMAVRHDGGRPSTTRWMCQERMRDHSMLHCFPQTGRTHQIRVHLRALGHPIVGDPFYGRRQLDKRLGSPRLMLHAFRLGFTHPISHAPRSFEVPPPKAFDAVLDQLRSP